MEKLIEKLEKETTPLISTVESDNFIKASEKAFDCIFDGTSRFYPWKMPTKLPKKFKLGIIVGSSGSGKSTILKNFGIEETPVWLPTKSVISHFDNPDDGINRLSSVGFNSIPSWYKPYHVLSTGERFRADLARKIKTGAVIDEFTSVIDRSVAKSASVALSRYIKNNDIEGVVLSTCHYDIVDWLEPDWVLNTDTGEFLSGFFFVRPEITIKIYRTKHDYWGVFKDHHYLNSSLNKATRCYVAVWDDKVIGFGATLTMPSGTIKNAWRESRVVILPDHQGMGLGVRFSNAIGQIHIEQGHRYFSRTSHPRMIYYRENSPLWKPTSKNKVLRNDISDKNTYKNHIYDNKRLCGSFEYIGTKI